MRYNTQGEVLVNVEEQMIISYFKIVWEDCIVDYKLDVLKLANKGFRYFNDSDENYQKYFVLSNVYEYLLIKIGVLAESNNYLNIKNGGKHYAS